MNQPNANIRHKREKAKMFSYKAASTLLTEVKQSLKTRKRILKDGFSVLKSRFGWFVGEKCTLTPELCLTVTYALPHSIVAFNIL